MARRSSDPKRQTGTAPAGTLGGFRSLAAVVRAYRLFHRPSLVEELESFRRERTLRAATERAAAAESPDGKRYDRQRLLSRGTIAKVTRCLLAMGSKKHADFDQLYSSIERAIGKIEGVGELMVYDTSLRIGAKLGLKPGRVYLHGGARKGAKALGVGCGELFVEVAKLPKELQALEPHEIADCLCIFEKQIANVAAG